MNQFTMTHRFSIIRAGQEIILYYLTGDHCPCFDYEGNNIYSYKWHSDNSDEEDCLRTGLINREEHTETLISPYVSVSTLSMAKLQDLAKMIDIGYINNKDIILAGYVDSDKNYISLSEYINRIGFYIEIDSVKYRIAKVSQVYNEMEIALIKPLDENANW